ncbi:hypothetical protein R3P38DRAFT_3422236 [Favolaschia claudopus]|uniref:F-box domain-containing protein n=1 Tax=Favolaschia claudopus TaxID=2862362 RepID=A0AAW0D6V8_9AGAR
MTTSWHTLPTEMKLAVVDNLDYTDARAFSAFSSGMLNSTPSPILNVSSRMFHAHIAGISMHADPLISILLASPRLTQLVLRLSGSVHHSVVSSFAVLANLRHLTIRNVAEEVISPLSERLVVSIAASIPNLHYLSLDRISRSTLHAPELANKYYPSVPLVRGDENIPPHPTLGSELSLPSLLSIPSLRQLIIRDTHLGDPRWATVPVSCRLEMLDLGSCIHEPEESNRDAINGVMAAVAPSLSSFSLATALSPTSEKSTPPLPRLRQLHISPFFPVDEVVDTMAALAGSPIEALSMQCFPDEIADACGALERFLSLRVERGPTFFDKLARIDVSIAGDADGEEEVDRDEAARRLQEFCKDLRLTSRVGSCVKKTKPRLGDRQRSNSCAF